MRKRNFKIERETKLTITKIEFGSGIFKADGLIIDDPYYFEANAWLYVTFETPEGFSLFVKVEDDTEFGGKSTVDTFIKECSEKWKEKWKKGNEFPHNYLKIELDFNLEDPEEFF